jgi:exodeoxyribonuclease VII large subunit
MHASHERARERLRAVSHTLDALSPLATLARGYAIVQRPDGSVMRNAGDARVGETLRARLARGELSCRVEDIRAG